MKSFRSTYIFLSIVAALIAFAFYDYNNSKRQISEKENQKYLFPDLSMDQVKELSLSAGQNFHLVLRDRLWYLQKPFEELADQIQARSYIQQILTQQVRRIPKSEYGSYENYGFAEPLATYEILADDKNIQLEVGARRSYDQGYYLRKNDSDDLFVGHGSWTSLNNKLPEKLQNMQPFTLAKGILRFSIKGPSVTLSFNKDAKQWLLEGHEVANLDQQQVQNYLTRIKNLRALDIEKKARPTGSSTYTIQLQAGQEQKWEAQVWVRPNGNAKLVMKDENKVYLIDKEQVSGIEPNKVLNELVEKSKTVK